MQFTKVKVKKKFKKKSNKLNGYKYAIFYFKNIEYYNIITLVEHWVPTYIMEVKKILMLKRRTFFLFIPNINS